MAAQCNDGFHFCTYLYAGRPGCELQSCLTLLNQFLGRKLSLSASQVGEEAKSG